jgi:hypothetical protein
MTKSAYPVYNKLSDNYNERFFNTVKEFLYKAPDNRNYTCFYPSFGIKSGEKTDFLIYGQAVKGWTPNINSAHKNMLDKVKLLNEAINFSNNYLEDTTPLEWVNIHWCKSIYNQRIKTEEDLRFYNGTIITNEGEIIEPKPICFDMYKSFFWNVTYKLVNKYYNEKNYLSDNNWTRKMIWSNLYKIAPSERANPNDEECKMQEAGCVDLVKKELEEIKPKFCIVLTNDTWWEPFRKELKTTKRQINKIIESVETFNETKIIVTDRPFMGNNNKYVEEILNIIKMNKL